MIIRNHSSPRISCVIPVLNESSQLPEFLESLCRLKVKPDEVIFVDNGSYDGSKKLIKSWIANSEWGMRCRLIERSFGFPGAGRNTGISAATGQYIFFLDVGVLPHPETLVEIANFLTDRSVTGVIGGCIPEPRTDLARAIAFVTSGLGNPFKTLPGSVYAKKVFDDIGAFDENLRAGEDLVWLARYRMKYPEKELSTVYYSRYPFYPENLRALFTKWKIYYYYYLLSRGDNTIIKLLSLFMIGAIFMYPFICICAYLLGRCFIIPLLKNRGSTRYLERKWQLLVVVFPVCFCMDAGKIFGALRYVICKKTS